MVIDLFKYFQFTDTRWLLEILEIARSIVNSLEEKKGENIVLMDLKDIVIFADYFVICSGSSDRMIQGLADSAIDQVKKDYRIISRVEGQPEDGWMLVDFGDIILHIFSPQRRDYYRLEDLWSEGKVLLHVQ